MIPRYCYKKRVEDNEMIFIGETEITQDGTSWEVDFFYPTRKFHLWDTTPSLYYPEFYIEGKEDGYEVINVNRDAYECQLYISPPVDINNLPYVTGLIDPHDFFDEKGNYDKVWKDFYYYIDKFENDRLVNFKLETVEDGRCHYDTGD